MPKDACYRKAKAKYRVFPSAYASGYIAKCRKRKGKIKKQGGVVKMKKGGMVSSCCCNMDRFSRQHN
tara:strand:+ start:9066 stop:9266 length:201 start_codon:yes stop_codon:yes gene_type:complete